MGIRIGEAATATANIDVCLDYRCSKCGMQNRATQKITAAASSNTVMGIESNGGFMQESHNLLYEKLKRLCRYKPAHRYTTAEFSCRCQECGHREPWAKMRYSHLTLVRLISVILGLFLWGASGSVYFILASALIFAVSYIYKALHLKWQQKKVEKLPAHAIPKITMQSNGNIVELLPPLEISGDSWMCYNCGELQPKENTYCDYCNSSKAWSQSKHNNADR